ncbi:hypothetical protein [Pandoraea bronchicola]|uniref:hypothetical protein n=1 Tax=Pandoraea bronchicola TaxID=2508287 RepID=UPI001582256C|nr:hypothetical protein [Pandoraea bronchicola]
MSIHAKRRSRSGIEADNLIEKSTYAIDVAGHDGGVIEVHDSAYAGKSCPYSVARHPIVRIGVAIE